MKKLLILALASAFVAAANADATINWGVTTSTLTNASWNDNNAPGVVGSVFKIDADVGDGVALLPSGTAPDPQVKTVVTVEATFTAVSDSLESLTGTDAKTALTVQNVNNTPRYLYWDGNGWEELNDSVVAVTNAPVEITIELDNDTVGKTTVAFKVVKKSDSTTVLDESVDLTTGGTETYLTGLAFAGTGDLTSVAATVTPAYATKTVNDVTTRYATAQDAVDASGTGAITLYKQNDAFGAMPIDENKLYFPINVIDNRASLYSFNKATEDNVDYYQIASADDLIALKDAVANVAAARSLSYKQTANIELTAAWEGIGVKAGKDLVNGDNKNIPAYEAGAFSGTYDGGNHTIFKFQMESGTDYGGLFNSIDGATIKNLKVSYKENKLCADSSATGGDTGATFVGVARNSTLQNLTALAMESVTTVSASKDMGGIVAYLMAGSTVDSCTNELNVASLKSSRKSGGIAIITQDGSGTATICNCKNSGTVTASGGQYGGIVGYIGTNTAIIGCENTAVVPLLTSKSGTVTVSGSTKSVTNIVSCIKGGGTVKGLNFATVSDNVATFVADDALAAGNSYKVMADGATATATLANENDTISFDTSLATPTYAITAATGLVAKSTTSGNVTTYTADEGYEVVSTAKTTLVSVPKDCYAAELIDLSNRAEGDVLTAYNATTERYYTWVLVEVESDLAWNVGKVFVTDANESTAESNKESADTYQLKAGQAVWLTRENPNATIKLAVAADGPVKVDVGIGYNLVAPPPAAEAYDATSLKVAEEGSFDDGDQIVVPTTTAPLSYTRMGGVWKVLSGEEQKPTGLPEGWGAVADPAWTEASKIEIPSGQGFWFNSKKAKKLEF